MLSWLRNRRIKELEIENENLRETLDIALATMAAATTMISAGTEVEKVQARIREHIRRLQDNDL